MTLDLFCCPLSLGSRWGQIRSRAVSSPDSGSALLPLLRPQLAVGERREGEGDATGGEREAKSKVYCVVRSRFIDFIHMCVPPGVRRA